MRTGRDSQELTDRSSTTRRLARHRRDAALERAGSITKSVAVASVAAVAVIGIYFSRALPGHRTTSPGSPTGAAGTVPTGSPNAVSPSDSGSGGQQGTDLAPPNSPPTPIQQQSPVVSGSS